MTDRGRGREPTKWKSRGEDIEARVGHGARVPFTFFVFFLWRAQLL